MIDTHIPIHAFGITIPEGIPDTIQWMPPGVHRVRASQDGKPVELDVKVTAAAAERLQQQLQELRSKAAAGHEDLPYLDFNHNDEEASARVLEFSWGGEDPVNGGIRAKVEWTGVGRRALQDKAYRRFSPSFFPNADGEIASAPLNMGGLVNRAAFKTIKPIVAGSAGDPNERIDDMNAEKLAADLEAARKEIGELQAKLSDSTSKQEIQAKETEITTLKAKISEQEGKLKEAAKANAEAKVEAAVKAGKLAPQNKELQAKWVDMITENPDRASMLDDLAPVSAKPGTVIDNGGTPGKVTTPGSGGEHPFVAKANAYAKENSCHFTDATVALAAKEPDLYSDYCKSLTPAGK